MAVTSYSELQQYILDVADRTDITAPLVDNFIFLAEARANQKLRVPSMETTKMISSVNSQLKIPSDFLALRRITSPDGDKAHTLQYVSFDDLMTMRHMVGGNPNPVTFFSRQGPYWYLDQDLPDGTNFLTYYYKVIPQLTGLNQVNWLLALSPASYIYGALKHLYEYVFDQDRAAYWEGKFEQELDLIQQMSDAAQYSGTLLSVTPNP